MLWQWNCREKAMKYKRKCVENWFVSNRVVCRHMNFARTFSYTYTTSIRKFRLVYFNQLKKKDKRNKKHAKQRLPSKLQKANLLSSIPSHSVFCNLFSNILMILLLSNIEQEQHRCFPLQFFFQSIPFIESNTI